MSLFDFVKGKCQGFLRVAVAFDRTRSRSDEWRGVAWRGVSMITRTPTQRAVV